MLRFTEGVVTVGEVNEGNLMVRVIYFDLKSVLHPLALSADNIALNIPYENCADKFAGATVFIEICYVWRGGGAFYRCFFRHTSRSKTGQLEAHVPEKNKKTRVQRKLITFIEVEEESVTGVPVMLNCPWHI
jgi:hypothetical protein